MTKGIYLLKFNNTDKVYIGQSTNIEARFIVHKSKFRRGVAGSKLQDAYNVYGIPELNILVETEDLDFMENIMIEEFNSVSNGFNVNKTAGGGCSLSGEDSSSSRFTNEEIEQAFLLLVNSPSLSAKQIAEISKVSKATVDSLSSKPRGWLESKYPEEYKILKSRPCAAGKGKTLKERGIRYPDIQSPEGTRYTVENTSQFAKDHNLNNAHLVQVLKGKEKQHKGWRLVENG